MQKGEEALFFIRSVWPFLVITGRFGRNVSFGPFLVIFGRLGRFGVNASTGYVRSRYGVSTA